MKLTATILSVVAAASLVSAGTFHPHKINPNDTISNGYIIQYDDNVNHAQVQNSLKSHKVDFKVRNQYNVFNGAAVTLKSGHKGEELAKLPGVKNVWPITLYRIPKLQKSNMNSNDPAAASLHTMTGVDIVHKKYKLTGKGVKVGVIDTGIDYKHPSFAAPGAKEGCFARYGKNCRVKYGWDFVGDDYTGEDPKPDSDPRDCGGHGTHVAGILGGGAVDSKTSPKPPQPFVGSAGDDVILAAMELAFSDGMDVINMSLGSGSAYKNKPVSILGDKLIAHGMALVAAAGNDGSDGVWMVSDDGLGDLASSIASIDNIYGNYDSVSYGGAAHPYSPSKHYNKRIDLPASATLVPIFEKDGSLSDGCDPNIYKSTDVKGKVVLVFGDLTRCESARGVNAKDAGAAGILVQTTPIGLTALTGNPGFPMGSIENKAGNDMLAAWKKDPKTRLVWSKKPSNFLIENGGAPSVFSSFGLDGDLRSKPDFAGPGGNILSTFPLAKGGYAILSGTSMASPYVAGAHALYIQAKESKPRGDKLRQIFKNTATIVSNFGPKTKASAAKQGAGLINVLSAITTKTSIFPDHIDLLDSTHFKKTVKISIKNEGKHTETYTLSHIPADTLNSYPNKNTFPLGTPVIEAAYATVKFSADKVNIPAGKTAKITLTFKEPKKGDASEFPLYSGYVVAIPKTKGGVAVHVPYTGVKGDIAKVPIFDTDSGFPLLRAHQADDSLEEVTPDYQFNLTSTKLPAILTRLGSHTPEFSIRIFDDKKNFVGYARAHRSGLVQFFGWLGRDPTYRNDGSLYFNTWIWDGMYTKTTDPSETPVLLSRHGVYSLVVAAQHKLSKGAYPKDFETHEFSNIVITGQQK
ncbi:peptidase S8/S53 domain-containing protein [Lobosporangium transversale]|uniref:Peptidase S8/S53 domain-containing protein n=1 Tax=Lobosporangium transversale TaxID=64571 RepID=A0A1Y2GPC8_9FUNG|nr:peptidase S8/S53 domain-containing protein [Lobosporangium transversale]ORZ17539.1 peptidase S8/S53 domain-containing protein [Lobosporangium transversale]|eukprot:XP_021881926.1 peptidase S8/S53 domain-containing protein [Lobosporangium transversale]